MLEIQAILHAKQTTNTEPTGRLKAENEKPAEAGEKPLAFLSIWIIAVLSVASWIYMDQVGASTDQLLQYVPFRNSRSFILHYVSLYFHLLFY